MNLPPLPIDPLVPHIAEPPGRSTAPLVVAPPAEGKATRLAPALAAAAWLSGAVVMLQPRRVAARASAARIAAEQGWRLGEEVGYQVRFDNRTGPRTRLRVVTEGILTRTLA